MHKTIICLLPFMALPQLFAQLPVFYKKADRITWVVDDVDRVTQGWKSLGFEQIHDAIEITLDRTKFRGMPLASKVRVAAGRLGAVQIRRIQPVSGRTAYSEFLARHGSGVFSLVHRVPSQDALNAEVKRLKKLRFL